MKAAVERRRRRISSRRLQRGVWPGHLASTRSDGSRPNAALLGSEMRAACSIACGRSMGKDTGAVQARAWTWACEHSLTPVTPLQYTHTNRTNTLPQIQYTTPFNKLLQGPCHPKIPSAEIRNLASYQVKELVCCCRFYGTH